MKTDGEWGQFFPVSMSPFAYNESLAQENFPLTQKQAEKRGWLWREKQHNVGQVDKIIPAIELPDDTNDIPDDILNWALTCSATGNPYRIIPHELRFYRQHNLPIPRFHFDERHQQRMTLRNLRMLASKQCSKCVKNIQAALPKGYQGKVYCDECYLKEVY
jgi:hypothetical protein